MHISLFSIYQLKLKTNIWSDFRIGLNKNEWMKKKI